MHDLKLRSNDKKFVIFLPRIPIVGIKENKLKKECSECGELIPPRRLKAVPNATLCVGCLEESGDVFRTMAAVNVDDQGDAIIVGMIKDKEKWEEIKRLEEETSKIKGKYSGNS